MKRLMFRSCIALAILSVAVSAKATLINLGEAGDYAVLSLTGTFLNLSNVTVNGDVGVGPNGSASVMAPSTVNGTLFTDPTATVSGPGNVTGGIQTKNLQQAVNDAISASNAFNNLAATQMFSSISAAITINGNGGDNVIKLTGGINLGSGNLTLNGGANDFFIFDIKGGLQLGGSSSVVLSGGVTADHVVFNFLSASNGGDGSSLMTHVGNTVQGTVLAVDRDITFHGVFGEVIGGGSSLTLMSGATVNGIPFIPEVTPSSVIFGFLGLVVAVSSRRALGGRVRAVASRSNVRK
jgi:Ice-binding-like